jgi:hypothetical protein
VAQDFLQPDPETQAKGEQSVEVLGPQVPCPSHVDADCVLPVVQMTVPQNVPALFGCRSGQAPEDPEQTAASMQSVAVLQTVPVL